MTRKLSEWELIDRTYNHGRGFLETSSAAFDPDDTRFTDVTPEFLNRRDYVKGVLFHVDGSGPEKLQPYSPRTLAGVVRAVKYLLHPSSQEWDNLPSLEQEAQQDPIEQLGETMAAGFHSLSSDYQHGDGFVARRTLFGDPSVTVALPPRQPHLPPEIRDPSTYLHTTHTPDGIMARVSHGSNVFNRRVIAENLPAVLVGGAFRKYMGKVELTVAEEQLLTPPTYVFEGGHSSTIDLNRVGDTLESFAREHDLAVRPLAVLERHNSFVQNQITGGVYDKRSGVGIGVDIWATQFVSKSKNRGDMRAAPLTDTTRHGALFRAQGGRTFLRAGIHPVHAAQARGSGRPELDTEANPLYLSLGPGVAFLVEASHALHAAMKANGR